MEEEDRPPSDSPVPLDLRIGEIDFHKRHQSPSSHQSIPLILSHLYWQSRKVHHLRNNPAVSPIIPSSFLPLVQGFASRGLQSGGHIWIKAQWVNGSVTLI